MYYSYDENGNRQCCSGFEYAGAYEQPRAPKKNGGFKKTVFALIIVFALVLGCTGTGAVIRSALKAGANEQSGQTEIRESSGTAAVNVSYVETGSEMTAAQVYAANAASTVGISVTCASSGFFGQQYTSSGSGSGFIITADGYIVTNYHVIEDAQQVTVTLYDDSEYTAEITGYDESNDIAVIKIDAQNLSPVTLGDSDSATVGSDVVAIGNPLGELTFTLTKGIVSALDREVTMSNGITMDLIQTDCAINSGNSGGALFNMYGEVIGITNAKFSSSSGGASVDNIAFAIPVNSVKSIITEIIETGYKSSSSGYTEEYIYPYYGYGYGSRSF